MTSAEKAMLDALKVGKTMRDLQKRFFRGDRTVVAEAKKVEKEFDAKLAYAMAMAGVE